MTFSWESRRKNMPIYEYRCGNCEETIEIMQKFSDQPLRRCPSCKGKVSRIISNCTFHLKGTGWYVTDCKQKESGEKKKKPAVLNKPDSAGIDSKKPEEKKP